MQVQIIVLLVGFDAQLVHLCDHLGQTALHVASQLPEQDGEQDGAGQSGPEVVSLLLRVGSNPAAVDNAGFTPLNLTANRSQSIAR
jgi:ankyrin repeat protein